MGDVAFLSPEGQELLALLVSILPTVKPVDPRTFIGYKEAHDRLGLVQVREKWGESLKTQGLNNLADWTHAAAKPAITGLIIDRTSMMPGKGYFDLFGRSDGDFNWWISEIERSKNFDWLPFLPRKLSRESPVAVDIEGPPDRLEVTINRIIRDTVLSRRIKNLHDYQCQLCGHTIVLADGSRYAEAHHIQPLGKPHDGPDVEANLVCLCPNHHAELDFGTRSVSSSDLRSVAEHKIDEKYIDYHNSQIYRKLR